MTIPELIAELDLKQYPTNNLPMTKKMWRDGYNKSQQEIITKLKALEAVEEPA